MSNTAVNRSGERGIAMIVAMFMVLILSVLGSSMMFVSQTETLSSLNYKTMSQTRYGAESGIHSSTNYLIFRYAPPGPTNAADSLASYNWHTSPVTTLDGVPVVLSSDSTKSNYPVSAVKTAFATTGVSKGTLNAGVGTVAYTTQATLVAMRQIQDAYTGAMITLQTWELTGTGSVEGAGSARLDVTAVIERQAVPAFKYAAFATYNGCDALKFGGGATTDSYDSEEYAAWKAAGNTGSPTSGSGLVDSSDGNVGTNGNLDELGSTTVIHGSLSTPRTGVGACTASSVTALTLTGGATLDGPIIELPQAISYPNPPAIDPLPPTGNNNFNGGCAGGTAAFCTVVSGDPVIDPATNASSPGTVTLGDVRVGGGGGTNLHLKAGTYVVNSLSFTGGGQITIDSGPVIVKVAGQSSTTPIDFTGGTITNSTYNPQNFEIFYGGTDNVKLTGGSGASALIYAPNATASFSGGADFYGAVVAGKITDMGGAKIHYDRRLKREGMTAGNFTMTSFTWQAK